MNFMMFNFNTFFIEEKSSKSWLPISHNIRHCYSCPTAMSSAYLQIRLSPTMICIFMCKTPLWRKERERERETLNKEPLPAAVGSRRRAEGRSEASREWRGGGVAG
jgi:hypothetical protein